MIELDENLIRRALEEGVLLQRIQMRVWKYMATPKLERDGVEMANDILSLVREADAKLID